MSDTDRAKLWFRIRVTSGLDFSGVTIAEDGGGGGGGFFLGVVVVVRRGFFDLNGIDFEGVDSD